MRFDSVPVARCSGPRAARPDTPFCTSRTRPDAAEPMEECATTAASIGMLSHVCRVSTVSVTLGFWTTPLITRCTTAARTGMFAVLLRAFGWPRTLHIIKASGMPSGVPHGSGGSPLCFSAARDRRTRSSRARTFVSRGRDRQVCRIICAEPNRREARRDSSDRSSGPPLAANATGRHGDGSRSAARPGRRPACSGRCSTSHEARLVTPCTHMPDARISSVQQP